MEGRPLDDTELVDLARNGDLNAFEALVQRYQELAFRVAFHVTGNAADAEDAAQEALMNAYAALPRFRPGASFRPWLVRIVANEAKNRRSSASRRSQLAERIQVEASGEAAPSPEAAAESDELRRLLLEAMRRLREEDRLVLAYRYFLDFSEAEMAEALACPRGTVKSRLSRALARLRGAVPADLVSEEGEHDG